MTENKERVKEKARRFYVRPLTEVYSADSCALLAGTYFHGDGNAGSGVFGNYFHGGGNAGNASFGSSMSGGGSPGAGLFGSGFSGGASPNGGDAGAAHLVTGAKEFGIGFSDVWE